MRLSSFFTGRSGTLVGVLLGLLVLTSMIGTPIGGASASLLGSDGQCGQVEVFVPC